MSNFTQNTTKRDLQPVRRIQSSTSLYPDREVQAISVTKLALVIQQAYTPTIQVGEGHRFSTRMWKWALLHLHTNQGAREAGSVRDKLGPAIG
jgi:hypothetical protein